MLIGAGGLALAVLHRGTAILGVAIGATLGSMLDIGAALLVGIGVAVVLHCRRTPATDRTTRLPGRC